MRSAKLLSISSIAVLLLTVLATVWFIAFITMYAAWPALWGDPFNRIWERIVLTTDFTKHQVLFEGRRKDPRASD